MISRIHRKGFGRNGTKSEAERAGFLFNLYRTETSLIAVSLLLQKRVNGVVKQAPFCGEGDGYFKPYPEQMFIIACKAASRHVDITPHYRIVSAPKTGTLGQSALSCGRLTLSNAGWHGVLAAILTSRWLNLKSDFLSLKMIIKERGTMAIQERQWLVRGDVRIRTILGKTLLLAIRSNRLLVLNEQAATIWDLLNRKDISREVDIIKALQEEYEGVSKEVLQTNLRDFLEDLWRRGFVQYTGGDLRSEKSDAITSVEADGHFSFSEELHHLAAERRIPISAGLELTQRCHLKCLHCYIDNQPSERDEELSTREWRNVLTQAAKAGCLWLLITGGDPLLRRDFCEIYRCAKELGMIVTVFTSATNLSERIADTFKEYPPFLVEATLHGATATTFDVIAGIPGAFQKFLQGIIRLRERNIPFHLKMIVMRQNIREVQAARELALKLGAGDFRFDPMINADFFHSPKAEKLRISIKEALALDFLEPYQGRWRRVYRVARNEQKVRPLQRDLLFPCRAGKCSFTISANGQLLPCVLMRIPAFDLRLMSFRKAWEQLNRYTTTAQMRPDNCCRTCPVSTCSRCPAWGYLEHGNPDAKFLFACALERERERLFLSQRVANEERR